MLIIKGIDPGGTTGTATWSEDGNVWFCEQIVTNTDKDYFSFYNYLVRSQHQANLFGYQLTIVLERFNFRMEERERTKIVYTPAELVGIVKLFCWQYGVRLELQMAAEGKGFWTDDKIKKLDLWQPGQPHAMDALRHVLQYRAFTLKDKSLLQLLKPTEPSGKLADFYKRSLDDKYHKE